MKKIDFYGKKLLDKAQEEFNKDLTSLSGERQTEVRKAQQEVQEAIDLENSNMDTQFQVEAQMRAATGLHHRDAEILMNEMKSKIQRGTLQVGQTYIFQNLSFVWTPYNTVVKADLYIASMQDAVIKLTENIQPQSSFTNETTFGLIKLIFKRIFKRG